MEKAHRTQFETKLVESMPKLLTYSSSAFLLGSMLEYLMPIADDNKNIVYTFLEITASFLIISVCLISLTLFASGPGAVGLLSFIVILFSIQDNLVEKIKIVSEKFIGLFCDERPQMENMKNMTNKTIENHTPPVTQETVEDAQTTSTETTTEKATQQITPVLEKPEDKPIDVYYNEYDQDIGATSLSSLF